MANHREYQHKKSMTNPTETNDTTNDDGLFTM